MLAFLEDLQNIDDDVCNEHKTRKTHEIHTGKKAYCFLG